MPKTENSADLAHYFPENGGDYPPHSQKWGGRVPPSPPVAEPMARGERRGGVPADSVHTTQALIKAAREQRRCRARYMSAGPGRGSAHRPRNVPRWPSAAADGTARSPPGETRIAAQFTRSPLGRVTE